MNYDRILIDLTTSKNYEGKNPVGIVRTEREIAKEFLRSDPRVSFLYYDPVGAEFRSISRPAAERILAWEGDVATPAADQGRQGQISDRPRGHGSTASDGLDYGPRLTFTERDVFISAGLVWDSDFLEALFRAKRASGFFVAQVIYDIIPVIMPEYCVPGMDLRFPKFVVDASWTADVFYCISESTSSDVSSYLAKIDGPVPQLRQIRLGVDLARKGRIERSAKLRSLKPGKFVLYVSTIEPRKNHLTLFNVWRELVIRDSNGLAPLVFVGKPAWNVENMLSFFENCRSLYPKYIRILDDVEDAELEWLYRNARFTVYPSLYEGWGLPVAESLARGKVCVSSDNSSLPEAGAGFSDLVHAFDFQGWLTTAHKYLKNDDLLRARENEIKRYPASTWAESMARFREDLNGVLGQFHARG